MKLKGNYVLTALGDEYVAVSIREPGVKKNCMVRLNATGAEIWKGVSEGLSAEQIAGHLAEEYEVSGEEALESVNKTIDMLVERGIVER